jgi:hypothetical protein
MLKYPVFCGDSRLDAAVDEFVMIVSDGGSGVVRGLEFVERIPIILFMLVLPLMKLP